MTDTTPAGASAEYRAKREELLAAEIALRDQREAVAALRRQLPPGPAVEDYRFQEGPAELARNDPLVSIGREERMVRSHSDLILAHPQRKNFRVMLNRRQHYSSGARRDSGRLADVHDVGRSVKGHFFDR